MGVLEVWGAMGGLRAHPPTPPPTRTSSPPWVGTRGGPSVWGVANVLCTFCDKATVPLLTITIYTCLHLPKPEKDSTSSTGGSHGCRKHSDPFPSSGQSDLIPCKNDPLTSAATSKSDPPSVTSRIQIQGVRCEPITVPYLSPLVLRKELETVLLHEGDACLTHPTFADHHPILYWNLLWYFSRLRVPSHLPGLCLEVGCVKQAAPAHPSWQGADWQNIYISCLWDNVKYHDELGHPMYVQWQRTHTPSPLMTALVRDRTKIPKSVMQSVLTALHIDDLTSALRLLMAEVRKRPAALRRSRFPTYRDLLFLAAACIPPHHLNLTAFDREYRRAYERGDQPYSRVLQGCDAPPPIAAVFCRRYFSPLSLLLGQPMRGLRVTPRPSDVISGQPMRGLRVTSRPQ
ncbi:C-myc promoter-binding protein [Chionoecetes opilio]|uniref:C-myc promoter-binding protein n=1 Tax=Chionoecetes opilio TaxID=41210 RepID=A0A8J4YAN9_CHIOP|nr:C-myc promoter-binding protein [Chionoecetes opilio]